MVSYDVFTEAFLGKISEYDFSGMLGSVRTQIVDNYMKRSIAQFKHICKYDLTTTRDDDSRTFDVEIAAGDLDEIVDIVSEGMVVQWMHKFQYAQENLENLLSTSDFSTYSPAELLYRITSAYDAVRKNHIHMMREYSYNHGDLTVLHI